MKVLAKGNASFIFSAKASRISAFTRSILLIASATGLPLRHLVAHPVDDRLGALGQPAMRLDQQDHHIGIRRAPPGRLDHRAVQPPPGPENARRIDKHDLRLPRHADPANPRPRGLHLVGDDGNLRPDHPVQQAWICRRSALRSGRQSPRACCGSWAGLCAMQPALRDSSPEFQLAFKGAICILVIRKVSWSMLSWDIVGSLGCARFFQLRGRSGSSGPIRRLCPKSWHGTTEANASRGPEI